MSIVLLFSVLLSNYLLSSALLSSPLLSSILLNMFSALLSSDLLSHVLLFSVVMNNDLLFTDLMRKNYVFFYIKFLPCFFKRQSSIPSDIHLWKAVYVIKYQSKGLEGLHNKI